MPKYEVTITGQETSYSTYVIPVEAASLEEAKAKAQQLADDDEGEFANTYDDYCDPGDSYESFTVQEVKYRDSNS